jgi:predicted nucleotidyltransferase
MRRQSETQQNSAPPPHFLAQIKAIVREVVADADVLLYGSRARGTAHDDSDWDILVTTHEEVTASLKRAIRHRLYQLEWDTGQVISTMVYSRDGWNHTPGGETPFRRRVRRDAILL